eukprot:328062-Chlamydomonas_euryale.AAC.8
MVCILLRHLHLARQLRRLLVVTKHNVHTTALQQRHERAPAVAHELKAGQVEAHLSARCVRRLQRAKGGRRLPVAGGGRGGGGAARRCRRRGTLKPLKPDTAFFNNLMAETGRRSIASRCAPNQI